jgi:hypothetical protein
MDFLFLPVFILTVCICPLRSEDRFLVCHCLLSGWIGLSPTKQDREQLRQQLKPFSLVTVRIRYQLAGSYVVDIINASTSS